MATSPSALSARSAGDGLDLLREHLKACMGYEQTSESSFSARRRHLEALAMPVRRWSTVGS